MPPRRKWDVDDVDEDVVKEEAAAPAAAEEEVTTVGEVTDGILSQRYYEEEYPVLDAFVMARIECIDPAGVYVRLLEYGNMRGLILSSELSKRRFRSVTKLVKIGREEVVSVVRVDALRGYIDLSKKRVTPEDAAACEVKFAKTKKVQLMARMAAKKVGLPQEEVLKTAIWPLYKKYGHAYEGLRAALDDPDKCFADIPATPEVREALLEQMRTKMQAQALRLRANVQVSCSGTSGILAVKQAFTDAVKTAGQEATDDNLLEITLVASPLYSVIYACFDRAEGAQCLEKILDVLKTAILKYPGGEYSLQGHIVVVGREAGDDSSEASKESESEDSDDSDDSDAEQEGGKRKSIDFEEEEVDEGMGVAE